jgi:hypothetical protein
MISSGLLTELKRRSVFRVAVGYLVGAWLLTEVAGVATESFDAPGWVMRIVIVFLLIAGDRNSKSHLWSFQQGAVGVGRRQ